MSIQQYATDVAIILHNALVARLPLVCERLMRPRRLPMPGAKRMLVLPPDPYSPSGSLGDLAMLSGLMRNLRDEEPECEITVIGVREQRVDIPYVGEVDVVAAWIGLAGSLAFADLLRCHDRFFVLGADFLDGSYGASRVCRAASYCNYAAKLAVPVTITGFSFNRSPRYPAVFSLSRLCDDVTVLVRDAQSLSRFVETTGRRGLLCADVAFLMQPDCAAGAVVESWIDAARKGGYRPVGVNINRHALSSLIAADGEISVVRNIARALATASRNCQLAYLLIPHDFKAAAGDVSLLCLLEDALNELGVSPLQRISLDNPAAIKHVVGLLDIVITGRMHLAIASLGQGTPVMCISYQDKFEGLLDFFELSSNDVIAPAQCVPGCLASTLPARFPGLTRLDPRSPETGRTYRNWPS